jgi:hypothetical protein
MPAELRTFLQPGSQLVEASESGISPIQRSLKALKVSEELLIMLMGSTRMTNYSVWSSSSRNN